MLVQTCFKMTICLSQNRNQLCFILGFVLLLSPIDLLQGLKTENAYNMKVCPLNKTEWQKASQRLNCTDDMENPVNRYHCLPVHNLTTLMEFCYNQTRPRIVKGLCMVYVQGIKTLNYYNCSNFKEGCPDTNYFSDESYEFSRCMQIDTTRRCYLAEPSCRPNTHKSNDGRIPVALFISSAAVSVVIFMAIAATYKWRRRGRHNGTGEIDITWDNCQDVLAAADMIGITCVVTECTTFLQKHLDSHNCVGIYQFADIHSCSELKSKAETLIHKHFVSTSQEEEYLELTENLVVELLQSEQLCVSSEKEVLQAALRWLLHDPQNRKLSVFNVLNHIRFPIISETELEECLEICGDLSIKIAVKKFSQDLISDRKLCNKLNLRLVKPHLVQPRKSARKNIYVIGGYFHAKGGRWSDIHTLETVEKFDTFSHEWETVPSLQYPRNHMGTSVVNGQIYVVGGENESLIYDLVERYDPISRQWSTAPPLTQPRCGHALTSLGDCLYAFGGWVGMELGDTVEKFDPTTNEWVTVCKMPTLRFETAVTELDGLIYIIGGMDKDYGFGSELTIVESFNPVTKEWEVLAPMNTPRANASVATLNGYIYVMGGFNTRDGDLASVERFSPEENVWETMPDMNQKRTAPCSVSVNGLLYVMGGRQFFVRLDMFSCNETINSMECFDPILNRWYELPALPTPRCEAGAVVL